MGKKISSKMHPLIHLSVPVVIWFPSGSQGPILLTDYKLHVKIQWNDIEIISKT